MWKTILISASLTGCFCAIFALAVTALGTLVTFVPGMIIAFVSGFCGSLFAALVLRRSRDEG
ncbi:hypothetical protein [Yoonia sp. 2307UL14-13]|uniref:hypothetical protein n=1 Tax=Yoonia sp. 2307UL14-13 TaxID=3126506 RepID=UPI003098CE13